jgi:hypothetical protein
VRRCAASSSGRPRQRARARVGRPYQKQPAAPVKSSVLAVAVAAKVYAATATIRGSKRSGGRTIVGCAHCGRARDRSARRRAAAAAAARRARRAAAARARRARALHTSTIRYCTPRRSAVQPGGMQRHPHTCTQYYSTFFSCPDFTSLAASKRYGRPPPCPCLLPLPAMACLRAPPRHQAPRRGGSVSREGLSSGRSPLSSVADGAGALAHRSAEQPDRPLGGEDWTEYR